MKHRGGYLRHLWLSCRLLKVTYISKITSLREFVKLTSSWPPARVEGGSELRLMTLDPVDPRDPLDPRMNSKKLDLMRRRGKREP